MAEDLRLQDMSPDVEQPRSTVGTVPPGRPQPDLRAPAAAAGSGRPSVRAATVETVEAAEESVAQGAGDPARGQGQHADHHILREVGPDRWKWRAKIRQSPTKLRLYRLVVGFVGLFFIALGFVSGPLPGPGGIPLVLLGLVIWSSEFIWAQRLLRWFKVQLHRFQSWSRPQQALAWVAFFAVCGCIGYSYLLLLGAPGWVPDQVDTLLARLPGV